ncbi:MAG: hydrolase, partial [Alistipes sp.]|nr:hydrolase [Alistipes sp.]
YLGATQLAKAAEMVGNSYDQAYYTTLAEQIKEAFNAKYLDPNTKQYGSGSQCSNALPLFLEMVPTADRQAVLDNLVADIRAHGTRLTTGDVGNRYLFQTLARNGLNELMFEMHNHWEAPGYGFQLKYGATTLTEQWDPRQGSSWNHFMMGQIDEWLFRSLVGLQPDANGKGYQEVTIAPEMVGDETRVKATYQSLYGPYTIEWQREKGAAELRVEAPANCRVRLVLPGQPIQRFDGGEEPIVWRSNQ